MAGGSVVRRQNVGIGEVVTSIQPAVLDTVLGSCVAACLYDPALKIGGMNHILLSAGVAEEQNARFGVHAMELLINVLMHSGAERRRLVAKVFGGASLFAASQTLAVGASNAAFVRKFLRVEGIPLLAERLGGVQATKVSFYTESGRVTVRSVSGAALERVEHAEASLGSRTLTDASKSDVTLF